MTQTATASSASPRAHDDSDLPAWQRDLQQQIVARNAVELAPSQSIFASYARLHQRVCQLRGVDSARARLASEHHRLTARVRELEAAAASAHVHSARERELEQRCGELQERLRSYLEREAAYYKAMAEVSEWRAKMGDLAARVQYAEDALTQRNAELNLLKKEFVSMRDENATLRRRVADVERAAAEAHTTAATQTTTLQQRVHTLEAQLQHERATAAATTSATVTTNSSNSGGTGGRAVPQAGAASVDAMSSSSRATAAAAAGATTVVCRRAAVRVVYDAHGGSALQAMCLAEGGVRAAAHDAGSSGAAMTLVSAGSDKMLRFWDVQHGSELRRLGSGGLVLALHSSATVVAAGCADRVVRVWDVRSLRGHEMTGHDEKVVAVCVSASAQHAFSGSSDGTLRMWDVRQHTAVRTMLCMSTSNDVTVAGDAVFSAHYNGTVVVWDRRTATRALEVRAHARVATCVRVSCDGRLCVSLGRDNAVVVRDVRAMSRALHRIAPHALSVPSNMSRLALSPDSSLCAVGTASGEVLLLSLTPSSSSCARSSDTLSSSTFSGDASMRRGSSSATTTGATRTQAGHDNDEGDGDGGDETVVQQLSTGGHEHGRPVYSVVWGSDADSPLLSLGDDRRIVVWQ